MAKPLYDRGGVGIAGGYNERLFSEIYDEWKSIGRPHMESQFCEAKRDTELRSFDECKDSFDEWMSIGSSHMRIRFCGTQFYNEL